MTVYAQDGGLTEGRWLSRRELIIHRGFYHIVKVER